MWATTFKIANLKEMYMYRRINVRKFTGNVEQRSRNSSSVAEVQFSPVLPPFFENREPNRQIFFRTEQNWNRTV